MTQNTAFPPAKFVAKTVGSLSPSKRPRLTGVANGTAHFLHFHLL
jgi:hypothetical protein